MTRLFAIVCFGAATCAADLSAQSPVIVVSGAESGRVMRAVRANAPVAIDGVLNEVVWDSIEPASEFVQHEPAEGQSPTERTEARVMFDERALYVGVKLFDSRADQIIVGERRRDASLNDTDSFAILLDTYRDRRSAFVFGTTPAGIEVDGQIAQESNPGAGGGGGAGGLNMNWDGSWQVATSRDDKGWYAEFRIPFSTLRYGATDVQTWGLNFARLIRRRNEQAYWAPVPRNFDFYRVSLAGSLEHVRPPRQRLFAVTPYVLTSAQRDYTVDSRFRYPFEVGGDAKIGITPSMTLDLTYNTDFAQVEADEQQINLTRFSVFFPEKRPFFLENSGLFTVGTRGSTELFFSRRIGIDDDGVAVPILGGGRATGKLGSMNVGLLDIQTNGVADLQPANNYGVVRITQDLPNRSRIGALFANRVSTRNADDYNRTMGLDARLGVGSWLSVDSYAAATQTDTIDGPAYTYSVHADFSNRAWRGSVGSASVNNGFNPEVGFLLRKGYRFYEAGLYRNFRFRSMPWLREWVPHFNWRDHWGFDGTHQSGYLHLDHDVNFANGAHFSSARNWSLESFATPFEITDSISVAPGSYRKSIYEVNLISNPSAPFSIRTQFNAGGFLSGTRKGASVTLTARRGNTFNSSLRFRYDRIELKEGSFNATIAALRVAYAFTPRIYVQSLIQYNDQTEAVSGNVRFGWLNTAGTGLFLVINETQGTGIDDQGPLSRGVFLKFTRQFDLTR